MLVFSQQAGFLYFPKLIRETINLLI